MPAIVAGGCVVLIWKYRSHASAAWLVGLSAGYLAGHLGLDFAAQIELDRGFAGLKIALLKVFQPAEARDWLPALVVTATAIELLALVNIKAAKVAWVLRFALCLFLPWVLLRGSVYLPNQQLDFGFETGAWSAVEATTWLGGTAMLLFALWSSANLVVDGSLCRLRGSLATLVGLGATGTIALSGSLTTGQLLGTLTASLVGCGIAAGALKVPRGPEVAAGPIVAIFGGVLVIAKFLLSPELAASSSVLLVLAMAAAIGWVGPANVAAKRTQFALRALICVLCLTLVVVPAAREFAASQAAEESNPYQSFEP